MLLFSLYYEHISAEPTVKQAGDVSTRGFTKNLNLGARGLRLPPGGHHVVIGKLVSLLFSHFLRAHFSPTVKQAGNINTRIHEESRPLTTSISATDISTCYWFVASGLKHPSVHLSICLPPLSGLNICSQPRAAVDHVVINFKQSFLFNVHCLLHNSSNQKGCKPVCCPSY